SASASTTNQTAAGTSLTGTREYGGEQFSSSGGVANAWIAGRMSELDQALYGIPAYTDETVYPNTYYKEQTQQILRCYYRAGASEEPFVSDYVTLLDEESGLADAAASVLTRTAEGYRLTWTSQQLYSGAYLTAEGDDWSLLLADGSKIPLELCSDCYRVTESYADEWEQGDLVERTASGYRISHTTAAQPDVSGGAQADEAADSGYTLVMSYGNATVVEQEDGSLRLYDEDGNPIVAMEDGLYETSSGALVEQSPYGWSVTETRYEEICDNQYVQAELRLQGGTLTVKNETWSLLWDEAAQAFRTTAGNTVEVAADGMSVTVTVAGVSTSYQAYELTLQYTLHYATMEPIVRVENDGTLGAVSVYLPLGSYEVREISAPYGFLLNTQTQTVELTYADQTREVVFDTLDFYNLRVKPWSTSEEDQRKLGVGVYKSDADSGALLSGARFGLYTADDIYNVDGELLVEADTLLACATTDTDGFANFAVDIALMSKYQDAEAAEAELICRTLVSGDTVELSIDGNTALNTGNYYIQELTPPEGYLIDDTIHPVSFVYADEYTMYIPVYAEHANVSTEVTLTKMDLTGEEEVSGATISVYRILDCSVFMENGQMSHAEENLTLVDHWVSTEEAHTVSGIRLCNQEWPRLDSQAQPESIYIFREELPAPGYVSAEDIEFRLFQLCDEDGAWMDGDGTLYGYEVQVKNGEVWERLEDTHLYMYDDYTKLEISKADITTGEELAGARLELWSADENGKALELIESWVSGEDGYDDDGNLKAHFFTYLPIGSYVLIETAAPEGYLTAESVVFTVADSGEIQRVQMLDATGTETEPEPEPTEPEPTVPEPKTPGDSSSGSSSETETAVETTSE
ncbi:MAG: prealbumin-like fold domain-containing protein, partial [Lachnospiraceae bacterium]|nr:prealbumin-like fold domain-containing protein [Lachnospiraceae bacterium]